MPTSKVKTLTKGLPWLSLDEEDDAYGSPFLRRPQVIFAVAKLRVSRWRKEKKKMDEIQKNCKFYFFQERQKLKNGERVWEGLKKMRGRGAQVARESEKRRGSVKFFCWSVDYTFSISASQKRAPHLKKIIIRNTLGISRQNRRC